jgi:hypothetical protein
MLWSINTSGLVYNALLMKIQSQIHGHIFTFIVRMDNFGIGIKLGLKHRGHVTFFLLTSKTM